MSMTITVTKAIKPTLGIGGVRERLVTFTFDSAYPTGGWPVTADDVDLSVLSHVHLPGTCFGYPIEWDATNKKIMAYASAGTEMSLNASTLNGKTVRGLAVGV